MSNLPTVQLPAHLAAFAGNAALMGINAAAASGIQSGAFPQISIKASRFRLQQPSQEELVVPNLYLDVVVVDANPHGMQKIYYVKDYDPNSDEGAPPDCFSDNGVGPSNKSSNPQCGTCAACPHQVWGSKISKMSGKPTRACTDVKKIAVLIADNTNGPVFLLRIPPASLKNWVTYIDALNKHGIPAASLVTRLTFDPNASHPLICFAPAIGQDGQMPYINAQQAADVMEVIGTPEVDQCTGKNDVPIDPASFKPRAALAAPAPVTTVPPMPAVSMPPAPVAFTTTQPVLPMQPIVTNQPIPAAEAPKQRRSRKPAAAPALAAPTPVSITPAQPSFLPGAPPVPPGAGLPPAGTLAAPLAPAGVTNAALDDLLKRAMAQ